MPEISASRSHACLTGPGSNAATTGQPRESGIASRSGSHSAACPMAGAPSTLAAICPSTPSCLSLGRQIIPVSIRVQRNPSSQAVSRGSPKAPHRERHEQAGTVRHQIPHGVRQRDAGLDGDPGQHPRAVVRQQGLAPDYAESSAASEGCCGTATTR